MRSPVDARVALGATGLLRTFNDLGVLTAADVHVAARLGALAGETDERVLLAAALAVRGTRGGSVVLRLDEVPATVVADDAGDETGDEGDDDADPPPTDLPWPDPVDWDRAVRASPLVARHDGELGRPLRLSGAGLWLDRYWQQEAAVAGALVERAAVLPAVDPAALGAVLRDLWPGAAPDDQRAAAAVCLLCRVAVLGGGPGTGKTTTVARLLVALRALGDPDHPPRVALCAPTGRAAARLQEAVRGAAAALPEPERGYLTTLTATTLHRLLRLGRGTVRTGPQVRLPHDVVVVDEASMLSLPLFARLLEALRPGARLLLVGDPDQLASVEAGAVLADLVAPARDGGRVPELHARVREAVPHDPPGPLVADSPTARVRSGVALLTTGHRFGGAVAELAHAVRDGRAPDVEAVLRSGDPAVRFVELPDAGPVVGPALAVLRTEVLRQAREVVAHAEAGRASQALDALAGSRLLCAHRRGPRGVLTWNSVVHGWIVDELGVRPRADGRYVGLALLVTANDPDNGLSNGDTGVVLDRGAGLVVAFDRGDRTHEVPLGRLSDVRPLHALTVHRAQGSQADRVTVLLPPAGSPLNTRETFYTAVTRARQVVHVLGSADAVHAAVGRPVRRATGLRGRLSDP